MTWDQLYSLIGKMTAEERKYEVRVQIWHNDDDTDYTMMHKWFNDITRDKDGPYIT